MQGLPLFMGMPLVTPPINAIILRKSHQITPDPDSVPVGHNIYRLEIRRLGVLYFLISD